MKRAVKKRRWTRKGTSPQHQVRAYLSAELHEKLQQMAAADDRTHREFMRLLIKQEYERRNEKRSAAATAREAIKALEAAKI